ncbi:MAG: hypothetical protein ABI670_11785 [Chloroflexota bacterium]
MADSKKNNSKKIPAHTAFTAQPRTFAQVQPSSLDLFRASIEQMQLEFYLNSDMSAELFNTLGELYPALRKSGEELREMIFLAATVGDTLHVPSALCAELEKSAYRLDDDVMNWQLTASALPALSGFCWFSTPVRIFNSERTMFTEVIALTWTVWDMGNLDVADRVAPNGLIKLCGLVKAPLDQYGKPSLIVDWPLNTSYAQALQLWESVSGPDVATDNNPAMTLVRLFARLFHGTQRDTSTTWRLEQFPVPDDQWLHVKDTLVPELWSVEKALRTQLYFKMLRDGGCHIMAFVPGPSIAA